MTTTLDFLKLMDHYELKAHLLQALLAVLVVAPGAVAVLFSEFGCEMLPRSPLLGYCW